MEQSLRESREDRVETVGVCSVLAVHAQARSPAAGWRYCYLEDPPGGVEHAESEKRGRGSRANRLRR